jgi:hypothetical protein
MDRNEGVGADLAEFRRWLKGLGQQRGKLAGRAKSLRIVPLRRQAVIISQLSKRRAISRSRQSCIERDELIMNNTRD